MKILVVNTNYFWHDGISAVVMNMFQSMDRTDIQMDIMTINPPDAYFVNIIEAGGGRIYTLNRSVKTMPSYVWQLTNLIRKNGYDIVHAHGNSATLALEMVAAKLAGCKIRIAHSHNTTCLSQTAHKILKPIFYATYTHSLACGEEAGKWLFGDREFQLVRNGINTRRFCFQGEQRTQVRCAYGLTDDLRVIGHVGIFNEQKNQTFLIDILKELISQDPRYRLMMVGEGLMQPEIREKAERLGLIDYVIFTGSTKDVPRYLSACDLIVMPSLYEGLPLALVEEQANGLRCVVSGNITREADKTGNLTFLPLEAGAAHWAQVIREMPAEDDREEMSQTATEKIKACGYDIHTEAAALREYYRKAYAGERVQE